MRIREKFGFLSYLQTEYYLSECWLFNIRTELAGFYLPHQQNNNIKLLPKVI